MTELMNAGGSGSHDHFVMSMDSRSSSNAQNGMPGATVNIVSQPGAAVHKYFVIPSDARNPLEVGLVDQQYNGSCSRHNDRPLRMFIGPVGTKWMGRYQRWWTKTVDSIDKKKNKAENKLRKKKSGSKTSETSSLGSSSSYSLSEINFQLSDSSSDSSRSGGDADMPTGKKGNKGKAPAARVTDKKRASKNKAIESNDNIESAGVAHKASADEGSDRVKRRDSISSIKNILGLSSRRRRLHKHSGTSTENSHGAGTTGGKEAVKDDRVENRGASETSQNSKVTFTSSLPTINDGAEANTHEKTKRPVGIDRRVATEQESLYKAAVRRRAYSLSLKPHQMTAPAATQNASAQNRHADAGNPSAPNTPSPLGKDSTSETHSSEYRQSTRKAVTSKVKAYYHRHSQISENAVILSTRAVVRKEVAVIEALTAKYNETTSQRFRRGVQEWTEVWLALTKRGVLGYLTSSKRPSIQVLFPPFTQAAPRLSLFSSLDFSVAITYTKHSADRAIKKQKQSLMTPKLSSDGRDEHSGTVRVLLIKFPSPQIAHAWYREIGRMLIVYRDIYPRCFFGPVSSAALPPPKSVIVEVPEVGIKMQVMLGRSSTSLSRVPSSNTDDSYITRQLRCEATTVWDIRGDVLKVLLNDKVVGPRIKEWIDCENAGRVTIGMAWRRFDRLEWVIPTASHCQTSDYLVTHAQELITGPQLLEDTHTLEMRLLEHYPDSVDCGDETVINEPLPVEGFALLKMEKSYGIRMIAYHPVLITSHESFLFFIHAPRAARHLDVTSSACTEPNTGYKGSSNVRIFHQSSKLCAKQMYYAKCMIDITDLKFISPLVQNDEPEFDDDTNADMYSRSQANDSKEGVPDTNSQRTKAEKKGKRSLEFLRSKKHREEECKFKLVTRSGAKITLWVSDSGCMREWVKRLTDLRDYWVQRKIVDSSLRKQVSTMNYMIQGRRCRERDMTDWNDELAWADRVIWHACMIMGCRSVIRSGFLFRKRHRHQGMRRVFCILTKGCLLEYKLPSEPETSAPTTLFNYTNNKLHSSSESRAADIFDSNRSSTVGSVIGPRKQKHGEHNEIEEDLPNSSSYKYMVYQRSRSLPLKRCYVLSRFSDDLVSQEIMGEPWVMTDIGNYSGLSIADRIYPDGVLSHEPIQDCIFTLWKPLFEPMILRAGKAQTVVGCTPSTALTEVGESTGGEFSESTYKRNGSKDTLSSGIVSPTSSAPTKSSAMYPSTEASSDKTSAALQASGAVEGHGAFRSPKSASMTSGISKPGAYIIDGKVTVNTDGKHNRAKTLGAFSMASSLRKRVGVYRARSNTEMEQWVVSINKEIERMIADDEW